MTTATLERPQTIRIESPLRSYQSYEAEFERNFGPEDMHAIRAIAYIMNTIFAVALVMYGSITLAAWLGS